jgi:2-dehydropantoate 2-reductase
MRILVLGAGGIGGYYGGRLAQAGVDVTFLVRPRRAEQLARDGLVVKGPVVEFAIPVATVTRETVAPGYDAILLSCKAYDLDDAIEAIRPAAPSALILPLLNGIRHLERLDSEFGPASVTGGVAQISVTLEPDGTIRHLAPMQGFIFGPRDPTQEAACTALAAVLDKGGFAPKLSPAIMQDMWEKFVFLCTLAATTCLMRGTVGAIARTDHGTSVALDMLAECTSVATAAGYPPREGHAAFSRKMVTDRDSGTAASMLRDLQRGGKVEAEHIIGDMLTRALAAGSPAPMLRAAYTHLQVYQASLA